MPRSIPTARFSLLAAALALSACAAGTSPAGADGSPSAAAGPPAQAPASGREVVVLDTTMGRMVIDLLPEAAPKTVANFRRLVEEGFYDGLPFYRVVAGHVAQAGDGGENDQPAVPGEFGGPPHETGVVGLARDDDPDSGSTEFYVTLAPRPHLDGRYAVFGRVVEGLDVLERIGEVEVTEKWVGDDGQVAFHEPKTPIVIERARIERRPIAKRAPLDPGMPHGPPDTLRAEPPAEDGGNGGEGEAARSDGDAGADAADGGDDGARHDVAGSGSSAASAGSR